MGCLLGRCDSAELGMSDSIFYCKEPGDNLGDTDGIVVSMRDG